MENQELTGLISHYFGTYGREPAATVIRSYALVLSELTDDQIRTAFNIAVHEDREHPMPAGMLRDIGLGEGRLPTEQAAFAFDLLDHGLNCDDRRAIDFVDPLINATVRDLGGRSRLAKIPPEQFHVWTKKEFVAAYVANMRREPERERCRPLDPLCSADHVLVGVGRVGELPPLLVGGPDDVHQKVLPHGDPITSADYGLTLRDMNSLGDC